MDSFFVGVNSRSARQLDVRAAERRFGSSRVGKRGVGTASAARPSNKSKRLCRTFQKDGSCKWGDRCKFGHNVSGPPKTRRKNEAPPARQGKMHLSSRKFRQSEEDVYRSVRDSESDIEDGQSYFNSVTKYNEPHEVSTIEDLDKAAALAASAPVESEGSSSSDSSDSSSSDEDSGEEASMGDLLRQRRERVNRLHQKWDHESEIQKIRKRSTREPGHDYVQTYQDREQQEADSFGTTLNASEGNSSSSSSDDDDDTNAHLQRNRVTRKKNLESSTNGNVLKKSSHKI